MAISNPHFLKLQAAISPIISIGVGSAICTTCSKLQLDPARIENKDLPLIKKALVEHYTKFWSQKISDIQQALNSMN